MQTNEEKIETEVVEEKKVKLYNKDSIKFFPAGILLKDISKPEITEVDIHILQLIDTLKTMVIDFNAFGLAANQIGEEEPIVMINADFKGIMINPVITQQSNEIKSIERCLSFPGVEVTVKRFNNITVQYLNEDFEEIVQDFDGTNAIVIEHEVDHINGITFYKRASAVDKPKILRKLNKAKRVINRNFK